MPIWLIDFLGARDLDSAFILIALMTLPAWLGMIVFPQTRIVRTLAHPLVLPPLYCVVLIMLLWKSYDASLLPGPIGALSYSAAKGFTRHPVAFLAFFCNLQIMNLALGTFIYQKAQRSALRAPVELLLCWFVGAPALIPFAVRLLLRRKSLA
jgi:hypothetical protein